MRRAVLAAIWIIAGAAIWNGFFDLYVSRGEREYLQKRAEFELGLGAEPSIAAVMGEARYLGVIAERCRRSRMGAVADDIVRTFEVRES